MNYLSKAREWLNMARKHCKELTVAHYIGPMFACLEEARETVGAIGTTEEEIDRLLKEGYKSTARNWLNHIRTKKEPGLNLAIDHMRSNLQKAEADLADIQTNEEELAQLKNENCTLRARGALLLLRRCLEVANFSMAQDALNNIHHYIEEEGLSFESFGADHLELQNAKKEIEKNLEIK